VELHAAHGYLFHSFLSPLSNQRTDRYGGDLEGRSRLLLETYDAVRAAVGEDVPVFVRLSASEWTDGGFDIAEAVDLSLDAIPEDNPRAVTKENLTNLLTAALRGDEPTSAAKRA
ncbi:hypothetical protein KCW65_22210, partial [Mycobacterium tuberculosis]|nr:hypothetical protein [Mycobacterium tuberculosis]